MELTEYQSPIVNFFNGTGTDASGRSFEDYLKFSLDWMELCHDYVQWLLPLQEASQFNPDAPLLTSQDIDYFHLADERNLPIVENYLTGVDKFLYFLGIEHFIIAGVRSHCVTFADNFEERRWTWAGEFNHNHLRVTRLLGSLTLLGFEQLAYNILTLMKLRPVNPRSLEFWEEAITLKDR